MDDRPHREAHQAVAQRVVGGELARPGSSVALVRHEASRIGWRRWAA
jgi:hypothetical protein